MTLAKAAAMLWVAPFLVMLYQPAVTMGQYYYPRYYSTYRTGHSLGNTIGCTAGTCGVNAQCTMSIEGRAVCSCLPGHSGDPLFRCTKAECTEHSDCRYHQACQDNRCINPCDGACGHNSNCDVKNHVPVCSCPAQYTGDPFAGCRLMDPNEACHPSPCGHNTKCDVVNLVPTCSCLPGYLGNPLSGCRHECESDGECGAQQHCSQFKCVSPCAQCGINAECDTVRSHVAVCKCPKNYFGDPYKSCQPECTSNSDCPSYKPACQYNLCVDPCKGACGTNADCNLRGLTPICSCPRNMTGDPFTYCRAFTDSDLCEPNPCGLNSKCTPGFDNTNKRRPVCTCLPGYVGNALTSCQRGECQADTECPQNRACSSTYTCVDPCIGQCGAGAQCQARNHIAVCTCPDGTVGDALVTCNSKALPSARYFRYRYRK